MSILRLTVLALGLVGWLLASPTLAAEPARQQVAVVGATVEGVRVIPPGGDRVVNVQQPTGSLRQVKVALVEMAYNLDIARIREDKIDIDTGTMRCYEIRSLEADIPYCWALWSVGRLGNPTMFCPPGSDSFLAWVEGSVVSFEDVSQPNDRLQALTRRLNARGAPLSSLVQVRALIPEAETWGVDARYQDVRVVSLRKRDDGTFELVVSNPEGTKVYTIVGQGGEWRLAEPGGKAGPATGKPEPPAAAAAHAPAQAPATAGGEARATKPEPKPEEPQKADQ